MANPSTKFVSYITKNHTFSFLNNFITPYFVTPTCGMEYSTPKLPCWMSYSMLLFCFVPHIFCQISVHYYYLPFLYYYNSNSGQTGWWQLAWSILLSISTQDNYIQWTAVIRLSNGGDRLSQCQLLFSEQICFFLDVSLLIHFIYIFLKWILYNIKFHPIISFVMYMWQVNKFFNFQFFNFL